MTDMTKNEFIRWLEKKGACKEGLDWANAQESAQDILTKLERQDWLVWLVGTVGGPAWDEYLRVEGPAWDEYLRVKDPAWAEYERTKGLAWAEYQRVVDPAWDEYLRVKDPAWAEYQRVTGLAWAEFERVVDLAWAEYQRVTGLAAKKALTWERVVEAVRTSFEQKLL